MSTRDEFEAVRREPDPIRRGLRATELITTYQQRAAELARLRKAAIEEAHRDLDMSYTEIATALGITKGRVSQVKKDAAGPERVIFGVGPVSIGIPYRYQTTDRERPLIAAEDSATQAQFEDLLTAMRFAVDAVSSPPTVTSSLTLFSVKKLRLKFSSKSLSVGLKRLIVRYEPP